LKHISFAFFPTLPTFLHIAQPHSPYRTISLGFCDQAGQFAIIVSFPDLLRGTLSVIAHKLFVLGGSQPSGV
jgi:hypothetical protein